MKLKRIEIDAFGRLNRFSMDVGDGLNVVYGENENGKTTLMAFLKMMFYGDKSRGKQGLRARYKPWNGSPMSGAVEFTQDDLPYRMERQFGRTNQTDHILLRRLDTGAEEVLSGGEEPGTRFFGMSRETFERTVFIGQVGAFPEGKDAQDEIAAKLQNLVSAGDETVSAGQVAQHLTDAMEQLVKRRGNPGRLDSLRQEQDALREGLSQALEREEQMRAYRQRRSDAEAEYDRLQAEIASLRERLAQLDKQQNQLTNIAQLESRLAAVQEQGRVRDELAQLEEQRQKALQSQTEEEEACKVLRQQKSAAQEHYDSVKKALDEAQSELSEKKRLLAEAEADHKIALNNQANTAKSSEEKARHAQQILNLVSEPKRIQQEQTRRRVSLPLLILGLLAAAGSIAAGLLWNLFCLLGLLIAALLVVLSFHAEKVRSTATTVVDTEQVQQADAQVDDIWHQIDADQEVARQKVETTKAICDELAKRVDELQADVDDLQKETAKASQPIQPCHLNLVKREQILQGLSGDLSKYTAKIGELALRRQQQSEELAALSSEELASLEAQILAQLEALSEQSTGAEPEADALLADRTRLRAQISEKESQMADSKADIALLEKESQSLAVQESPAQAENRLTENEAEIRRLERRYAGLELAKNILEQAENQMRQSFSPILNQKTGAFLGNLTGGKYQRVSVSKELELSVWERSGAISRSWESLSSGTVDQSYLALRLAVSELLDEKHTLPILLDDVLIQYDDERADRAVRFLAEYAKSRQALFFTCRRATAEAFQKADEAARSFTLS